MRANFVSDIMTDLWLKYVSNVSQNLPQAILGVGFGAYKDSEHVRAVATGLWQEVVQVAAKKGVRLPERLLLLSRNRERGEVLNFAGSGCRKTHRD